jgi:hypothetical protein
MFLSCQSQYTELLARRRWRISINLHLPKAFWKSTIHVRLSCCLPLTAAAAAVRLLVCAAAAVHTEETLPVGKDQTDAAAFTFYIYGRGQVVPINPKLLLLLLLLLLLRIRDLGK